MLKARQPMKPRGHNPHSRVRHFVAGQAITVSQCLEKHFRVPPERAQALLKLGAIYSNQLRVFEDRLLEKGAYLRIHLQPKLFPVQKVDWQATILADTADYLVVRKPAGIPVHATVDNALDNALHCLREATGYPLLITQRIDTPVSGVMIFAKTPDFQTRFNRWLVNHQVKKRYRALVPRDLSKGLKTHYMEPGERTPRAVIDEVRPGWAKCELTVIESRALSAGGFEVEIDLHTGRTHQIRAQLARMGAPILGDRLYGSRTPSPLGRQSLGLCSVAVDFPSPDKKRVAYRVEPEWLSPAENASNSRPI